MNFMGFYYFSFDEKINFSIFLNWCDRGSVGFTRCPNISKKWENFDKLDKSRKKLAKSEKSVVEIFKIWKLTQPVISKIFA